MRRSASSASLSWGQDSTRERAEEVAPLGLRLRLAEQIDEPGIAGGGGGEPLPGGLPGGLGVEPELLGTDQFAVLDRVEAVIGPAPAAQASRIDPASQQGRTPSGSASQLSRSSTGSSTIRASKSWLSRGRTADLAASSATGTSTSFSTARRIASGVAASRARRRSRPPCSDWRNADEGPVLAVVLRPEDAPVLQLGERAEFRRALVGRPQGRPADAGQVEDRDGLGGQETSGILPASTQRSQMAGPVRVAGS